MTTNNTTTLNNLPSNCIMEILTYAGNPQNARVCKGWQSAQQDSYRQIFNLYRQEAKISQFIPKVIAGHLDANQCAQQVVQQTYCAVITKANAFDIQRLDLERTAPLLAINSIIQRVDQRIEDDNLIQFFSRLMAQIPRNAGPILTGSSAEKAATIRSWMNNNPLLLCQVTSLDLSNLNLTTLPKEIGRLTSLQALSLTNNQLSTLPKEIYQLGNLQGLFLSDNMLSALPKEIGQLPSLQWLSLSNNRLTTLPKEIGQLTNLEGLYLNKNQLADLPKEIGQLTNLRGLSLSNNMLTTLPKEIGQLSNLQGLGLSGNMLTTLPEEIGQLSNLRGLFLCNNKRIALPKEIGQLSNLRELHLYDTPLAALPQEIDQIPNLHIYR